MLIDISVCIIVKNGEKHINECLCALGDFEDVVVYDNGSTDNTKEIVRRFANVNLVEGEFIGFGQTKNLAATFAKNDWIFFVDADEVCEDGLVQEMARLKLVDNCIYSISRRNFYKEKEVKYCGWSPDFVDRIYNKKVTSFANISVHEHLITTGYKIAKLQNRLKHHTYDSLEEFVQKANHYSTLFAQNNAGKKRSTPFKAVLNGAFSFFKTYFLKQGFRDGYVGLVVAYSHMVTNFYKYIKLYELNKEKR